MNPAITTSIDADQAGALRLGGAPSNEAARPRLPEWLRRPLGGGPDYARTASAVGDGRLHTICEEARCPNRGECWSRGTATFLILGDECTRRCGFCSVKPGAPRGVVDHDEPRRLAEAIARMQLKYVVITSVDRDDLEDGGAGHFAECVRAIRARTPETKIELLTPDFRRRQDCAIETLAPLAGGEHGAPFTWGHNVETIPRLYRTVRPGSDYQDTLTLLRCAAQIEGITAKSSLMLGLGETIPEVLEVIDDLAAAGVERVTIGQYLRPTAKQLPVVEFIPPAVFENLAREARARGMRWVIAAPFARSSYFAEMEIA